MEQQSQLRARRRAEERAQPPAKPGRKAKAAAKPKASTKANEDTTNEDTAMEEPAKPAAEETTKERKGRGKRKAADTQQPEPAPVATVAKRVRTKSKALESKPAEVKDTPKAATWADSSKLKADMAYQKLIKNPLDDLPLPKLGDRKSFTVSSPDPKFSNIGVILYSESFYVASCICSTTWPASCSSLKVHKCHHNSAVDKYNIFVLLLVHVISEYNIYNFTIFYLCVFFPIVSSVYMY